MLKHEEWYWIMTWYAAEPVSLNKYQQLVGCFSADSFQRELHHLLLLSLMSLSRLVLSQCLYGWKNRRSEWEAYMIYVKCFPWFKYSWCYFIIRLLEKHVNCPTYPPFSGFWETLWLPQYDSEKIWLLMTYIIPSCAKLVKLIHLAHQSSCEFCYLLCVFVCAGAQRWIMPCSPCNFFWWFESLHV